MVDFEYSGKTLADENKIYVANDVIHLLMFIWIF